MQVGTLKCENSNTSICYKLNGESCILKENLAGNDDSQISSECKSGWCFDKVGIGGVCEDAPEGRKPHPLCAQQPPTDIVEEFANWVKTHQKEAILYGVSGFLIIVILFFLFRKKETGF